MTLLQYHTDMHSASIRLVRIPKNASVICLPPICRPTWNISVSSTRNAQARTAGILPPTAKYGMPADSPGSLTKYLLPK